MNLLITKWSSEMLNLRLNGGGRGILSLALWGVFCWEWGADAIDFVSFSDEAKLHLPSAETIIRSYN